MANSMRRIRGISVAEVLIATALAALLLTSIASALTTVCNGTRANEASMRARQAGTNSLNLILTKIRRSKELNLVHPTSTGSNVFTTLGTLDEATWDETASAWSSTGAKYTFFIYDNRTGMLYVNSVDSVTGAQPLLRNVRNVAFRTNATQSEANVEITIDVPAATGGEGAAFTIAGSAASRAMTN